MDQRYTIQQLTAGFPEPEANLSILAKQLNKSSLSITHATLAQLLEQSNTRIYIATENEQILGVIILCWYHILTGTRAWIEDVIVHSDFRGRAIGSALVQHVLLEAKDLNISQIDLTSRPDRVAANNLYLKLGFKKRETNCYRINLD